MRLTRTQARLASLINDAFEAVKYVEEGGPTAAFGSMMATANIYMRFGLVYPEEAKELLAYNEARQPEEVRNYSRELTKQLHDLWFDEAATDQDLREFGIDPHSRLAQDFFGGENHA